MKLKPKEQHEALPADGLVGEVVLREAAAGSFQDLYQRVSAALRAKLSQVSGRDIWPVMEALFPASVVVRVDGKLWRYAYVVGDDGSVAIGDPAEEVEEAFLPAGTARPASRGVFIEAVADAAGKAKEGRYLIRVIRSGLSENGVLYPPAVLREAAPLFNKARVFVKSDIQHIKGEGKDVRNLIGRLVEPRFVEAAGAEPPEIRAVLELIDPTSAVAVAIREAVARDMADLFGFSIDVSGHDKPLAGGRQKFREATRFTKVHSVDLIVEPGAGGGVIRMIEAVRPDETQENLVMKSRVIKFIESKRPDLLKDKDVEKLTEAELDELFREATEGQAPAGNGQGDAPAVTGVTQEQLDATVRMVEARYAARATIAASGLPEKAQAKLTARFEKEARFTEADVKAAIKEEREYLASFVESGRITGLGDVRVEGGQSQAEKIADRFDAFFDPAHKEHGSARSFKEAYIQATGDARVTGMLEHCDQVRLREALNSGSFANVLGNSIRRRLVADYRVQTQYDVWRRLTGEPVPANDFRTNERTRYGGYGDLPTVNQAAAYQAVTSPTDEKAEYAVTKRGGLETVTIEMIKNDDVGVIRRIPVALSRAAKRTLGKFVLDFIRANPTIYDTKALFHVDHGNLGTAALAAASLSAGRLAMLKQAEAGSNAPLGIGPRTLWVPPDLEEAASNLQRRNTENDKTFIQSLTLDIIPVWYWTDANDWALSADPLDIPMVELGFLDGQEEPEIFVQDNPSVGSMFTNDQVTYKIRHIYGAAAVDYRGLYKGVVA